MTNLKSLMIIVALLLCENSLALAQTGSPGVNASAARAHTYTARHHHRLHGHHHRGY
jgi:hypothetical protein